MRGRYSLTFHRGESSSIDPKYQQDILVTPVVIGYNQVVNPEPYGIYQGIKEQEEDEFNPRIRASAGLGPQRWP